MRHNFVGKTAVVEFSAIPRQVIDELRIMFPEPVPPTKEVPAFGEPELVYDYSDPTYLTERTRYSATVQRELLEIIYEHGQPEITPVQTGAVVEEYDELQYLGLDPLFAMLGSEYLAFVEELYYRSTVTVRGMEEASLLFGVTWLGRPVSMGGSVRNKSPLGFSQVFFDRMAATACGYSWTAFSALSGPEQSACVVYHYYTLKIQHLGR